MNRSRALVVAMAARARKAGKSVRQNRGIESSGYPLWGTLEGNREAAENEESVGGAKAPPGLYSEPDEDDEKTQVFEVVRGNVERV